MWGRTMRERSCLANWEETAVAQFKTTAEADENHQTLTHDGFRPSRAPNCVSPGYRLRKPARDVGLVVTT